MRWCQLVVQDCSFSTINMLVPKFIAFYEYMYVYTYETLKQKLVLIRFFSYSVFSDKGYNTAVYQGGQSL